MLTLLSACVWLCLCVCPLSGCLSVCMCVLFFPHLNRPQTSCLGGHWHFYHRLSLRERWQRQLLSLVFLVFFCLPKQSAQTYLPTGASGPRGQLSNDAIDEQWQTAGSLQSVPIYNHRYCTWSWRDCAYSTFVCCSYLFVYRFYASHLFRPCTWTLAFSYDLVRVAYLLL